MKRFKLNDHADPCQHDDLYQTYNDEYEMRNDSLQDMIQQWDLLHLASDLLQIPRVQDDSSSQSLSLNVLNPEDSVYCQSSAIELSPEDFLSDSELRARLHSNSLNTSELILNQSLD